MKYVQEFAAALYPNVKDELSLEEIEQLIEKPKYSNQGDLAFPCFSLAKTRRKSPQAIAADISGNLSCPIFEKIEVIGGYLNVFLKKDVVLREVLGEIVSSKQHYGNHHTGEGQVVTIDMSSPNIAKPFSMGHLRSTVIGNALSLILQKNGYETVKINHLGDWGTQFGKLITAYKKWGSEEAVAVQPIKELLKLYVRFHDEAVNDPALEDEARQWFKLLEDGNEEARALWQWFRDESLKEFSVIYDLMGIEFDSFAGEAFYNDKMDVIIDQLENMDLLTTSDGAEVVELDDENLPPALIRKSDGATLYATRDLAAANYRQNTYHFSKALYVVGNEQSHYFKQLKAVLKKMQFEWAEDIIHIPFGMMQKDGKKMSTRKGKVVLLEEVLNESIDTVLHTINERNPKLPNKEEVAETVGVGAVVFHDLKNYRSNDIEFSLEDLLRFEGETGPYVQYTHARACSLLRKGKWHEESEIQLNGVEEWSIIKVLQEYPGVVQKACEKYDPSLVAKYAIDLAQTFNKYYAEIRILEDDKHKNDRLTLVYCVTVVLEEALRLLGIGAPKEM
ncbi:arginine--tRNA ligase [Pradoshia sp.]